MRRRKKRDRTALSDFAWKVDTALREAVAQVIQDHRRSGEPLIVSRDGKVMFLAAEDAIREMSGDSDAAGPSEEME